MERDELETQRDYLRLVARFLWKPGLHPKIDLSEMVQRTLIRAYEKRDQFRGTTEGEKRNWLCAILDNVIRKALVDPRLRDVSLDGIGELPLDQTPSSEAAYREEQFQRLAAALGRLPEPERMAIELKYLHGCSVAFISEHMGRTKLAVAGLLKRGMHRLREALGATK